MRARFAACAAAAAALHATSERRRARDRRRDADCGGGDLGQCCSYGPDPFTVCSDAAGHACSAADLGSCADAGACISL
jgi:hypothetical protein